ncbi:MAG: extensin family protein [Neorhizobium sp.]|nr:extensin family protein [Neorhizobium sp.]
MAYASTSRRVIAALTLTTMLVACSAENLVPPASIDHRTRVGAIQPVRSLPREPVSTAGYQSGYQTGGYSSRVGPEGQVSQGKVSQGQVSQGQVPEGPAPQAGLGEAAQSYPQPPVADGGHYLRLPDQPAPAMQASSRMPAQKSARMTGAGVNMDGEFGFTPDESLDESQVKGLAEEEASDIAEGVGDQPVVDGIGTENPRSLNTSRQSLRRPIAAPSQMSGEGADLGSDRIIVPSKRAATGLQGDMAASREVAMLRPSNPAMPSAPFEPTGPMSLPGAMPASEASCRAELRRLGVAFEERPRISAGPSCGIDYPVKLSGLSGNIDVRPAVTLNCQTTLAFAKWVKGELAPSARMRYLTGVQRIVPLGGYSCRRMNNSSQRYNPMSEHSHGNAIDVGAIVLKNGHEIDVRKKGLFSFREGGLLKSVRNDSCRYFSTVLGPGSNAEHWNHFHFDLRSRKGGRRYCD